MHHNSITPSSLLFGGQLLAWTYCIVTMLDHHLFDVCKPKGHLTLLSLEVPSPTAETAHSAEHTAPRVRVPERVSTANDVLFDVMRC